MAIEKIVGIETEYGIAGGPGGDPIFASTLIVNAYAQLVKSSIRWDFEGEHPDVDARGQKGLNQFAPAVERTVANTVLTNGARLYVDHAHPEYSSPECRSPLAATQYDVAGEKIMLQAQRAANETLGQNEQIRLYKNNSDGKGNSYGTHENFLVSRTVPFTEIVRAMLPHFVSRQLLFGAGKVGAETDTGRFANPHFQLSQRAEFFEEVVGLETTMKRPIVNTRDEPHADAGRFRRLHIINGDANLSQVATFVKVGSTALLLGALEEYGCEAFPSPPTSPVAAIRSFAQDLSWVDKTCPSVYVHTESGARFSSWEYQNELWLLAQRYVEDTGAALVAKHSEVVLLMTQWRELIDGLRKDSTIVANRIDWIAKYRMVAGFRERYGLDWNSAKLAAIALQYHDIVPEKSLARMAKLFELITPEMANQAITEAPTDTRAYFRGESVRRYSNEIASANWDSIVFQSPEGTLQRVPMMDPTRGTMELTSSLFGECSTATELLERLER